MKTKKPVARDYCAVFVTAGSRPEARRIARALLERRLVACANIVSGVESHYWWEGKVDHAREWLLVMKTRRNRFRAVEQAVKQLHSYQVPEIIALPITAGHPPYLAWINAETEG